MNQYQTCLDCFECIFHLGIPNIVTKLQNVDIFYKICYILVLSSAHARRIVSVKMWLWSHNITYGCNILPGENNRTNCDDMNLKLTSPLQLSKTAYKSVLQFIFHANSVLTVPSDRWTNWSMELEHEQHDPLRRPTL